MIKNFNRGGRRERRGKTYLLLRTRAFKDFHSPRRIYDLLTEIKRSAQRKIYLLLRACLIKLHTRGLTGDVNFEQ